MEQLKKICFLIIERISPEIAENVKGDLEEVYRRSLEKHSKTRSFLKFFVEWLTCLKLILNENSSVGHSVGLAGASLKMSWRMLSRNRSYALVSLLGITTGLTASLIIFLFVITELSYDKQHQKANRIYRIVYDLTDRNEKLPWAIVTGRWAPLIKNQYPEVEEFTRLVPTWGSQSMIKAEGMTNGFFEDGFMWADSTVHEVFDFNWLVKDRQNLIANPNTIVVSEKIALKYFGDVDQALGKTINRDDETDYLITGVFEDMPSNSHFHAEMIASLMTGTTNEERNAFWNYSYLVLSDNTDPEVLVGGLASLVDEHVTASIPPKLELQPLRSIYLDSDLMYEFEPVGNRATVRIFIGVGFFILLIACINFINLSTAYGAKRIKEIGLKKVLGARRRTLIKQLIIESILITVFGVILALVLSFLLLPSVELLIGKSLNISYLWKIEYLGYFIGAVVIVGVLSGAYPALFISSYRPIAIFHQAKSKGKQLLRKGLSLIQFVLSISLIAGSLIVYQQMDYFQSKDMGIQTDQALVLPLNYANNIMARKNAFRTELMQNPRIKNMSLMSSLPGELIRMWVGDIRPSHGTDEEKIRVKIFDTDFDFVETLGIEIIRGRNYNRSFPTDTSNAVIINETAAKALGIDQLDTASIYSYSSSQQRHLKVIGIVEDFHFASLHSTIEPLAIFNRSEADNKKKLVIRLETNDLANTLAYIQDTWDKYEPARSFESFFLSEYFQTKYTKEQTTMNLLICFTLLAVFIACLGLFGLVTYVLQNRQKEVSVRKVLGASVGRLWLLLTSEFLVLILIAFCIATPIMYLMMEYWLSEFAYRINMGVLVFVISVIIVLIPSLLVVSIKSLGVASENPSEILNQE